MIVINERYLGYVDEYMKMILNLELYSKNDVLILELLLNLYSKYSTNKMIFPNLINYNFFCKIHLSFTTTGTFIFYLLFKSEYYYFKKFN